MKNFTLAIQQEFSPYGITVQLVTPMFVRTKMNDYSTTVMAGGNILIPDVQSYTKSAVFSLGKTNETTGYWSHGIQVTARFSFSIPHKFDYKLQIHFSHSLTVRCNAIDTNMGTDNNRQTNELQISSRILCTKSTVVTVNTCISLNTTYLL